MKTEILHKLDFPELLRMQQVSEEWLKLSKQNEVWEKIAKRIGFKYHTVQKEGVEAIVINHLKTLIRVTKAQKDLRRARHLCQPPLTYTNLRALNLFAKGRDQIRFVMAYNKVPPSQTFKTSMFPDKPISRSLTLESCREISAAIPTWCENHLPGEAIEERTSIVRRGNYTSIPEENGIFTKLENLNYSYNKITILPNWISTLSNLRLLSISYNCLIALPPSITKLKQLEVLRCSNNIISQLASLFELTALKELHLDGNRLTSLQSLPSTLQKVDLRNNKLTTLPESMTQLRKLKFLDCCENFLRELPPLVTMTALKRLDLHWNKLTALRKLPVSLQILHAYGNRIERICSDMSFLTKLKNLNLAHNYLSSIPDPITSLVSLEKLQVHGNLLAKISVTFDRLTKLKELYISPSWITQDYESQKTLEQMRSLQVHWVNQQNKLEDPRTITFAPRYSPPPMKPADLPPITMNDEVFLSFVDELEQTSNKRRRTDDNDSED